MHLLLPFTTLLTITTALSPRQTKTISTESLPNPIAQIYPDNVTGTINGTIAVIPIPYSLARSIIPAQYGILKSAYEGLLVNLPADTYPLVIRSGVDHDIQVAGADLHLGDFQSTHFKFPFVDLLGDGYSSFAYEYRLFITSTTTVGIGAAEAYGIDAVGSTFDPIMEAYEFAVPQTPIPQLTPIEFNTYVVNAWTPPSLAVASTFTSLFIGGLWPMEFYANVTNQPVFGNGTKCDQQITSFNTTLSTNANAMVGVVGDVTIKAPFLDAEQDCVFNNVFGVKIDVAFIENNYLDCEMLKDLPVDTSFSR